MFGRILRAIFVSRILRQPNLLSLMAALVEEACHMLHWYNPALSGLKDCAVNESAELDRVRCLSSQNAS